MRWRGVCIGVAGALVGLAACGGDTPDGAEEIQDYSEVGDCLRPDPGTLEGFLQAGCDDAEATVEIVEMVPSAGRESSTVCPLGTDLLVDGEQGPVVDGDIAAAPQTWCLRNLEPPHPGDPGMGGGELVPDDCFAVDGGGSIVETPCAGRAGGTAPQHRLLAVEETTADCPAGTAEPIELHSFPPQALCAGPV